MADKQQKEIDRLKALEQRLDKGLSKVRQTIEQLKGK